MELVGARAHDHDELRAGVDAVLGRVASGDNRTSSIASGEGEKGTVLTRASVATTPSSVACWLVSR